MRSHKAVVFDFLCICTKRGRYGANPHYALPTRMGTFSKSLDGPQDYLPTQIPMRVGKKWGSVDPHKPIKGIMKPATAITGNLFYPVIFLNLFTFNMTQGSMSCQSFLSVLPRTDTLSGENFVSFI